MLTFLNDSNYSTRSLDERARSRLYVLENVDLDVLTRNNKGVSDRRLFPHWIRMMGVENKIVA